jgi:hypothetical protein
MIYELEAGRLGAGALVCFSILIFVDYPVDEFASLLSRGRVAAKL